MHSTPPTSTPIDTNRRRFLTVAAGASVASVGALAAAAMPTGAPGSPACVDPIFAAIEAHKQAADVWDAAVEVWANFADGPEGERANEAWRAARDAMDDAGVELINTSPTTLHGIARALNYIRQHMVQEDGVYMPSGLGLKDDDYPEVVGWIDAFLDTVESATTELDEARKAVRS